jgi:hypothetical protein
MIEEGLYYACVDRPVTATDKNDNPPARRSSEPDMTEINNDEVFTLSKRSTSGKVNSKIYSTNGFNPHEQSDR